LAIAQNPVAQPWNDVEVGLMIKFFRRIGIQPPPRPDRTQLRSELFASLDAAVNQARTGLSVRDIADHLERRVELMRLADSIARPVL
jgi:hypothetical protein